MLPAHRVIAHKEYGNTGHPGRKSDPTYDMDWRRARVAAFTPTRATTIEEDDVSWTDNLGSAGGIGDPKNGATAAQWVQHAAINADQANRRGAAIEQQLASLTATVNMLVRSADVDEAKLAAALAPSLVPAVVAAVSAKAGLTREDVEQAVRDVLRSLQSTLPEGDAADPR